MLQGFMVLIGTDGLYDGMNALARKIVGLMETDVKKRQGNCRSYENKAKTLG